MPRARGRSRAWRRRGLMGILAAWLFAATPLPVQADFRFDSTAGFVKVNRSMTHVRRGKLDGSGVQKALTNTGGLGFGGLDRDPVREQIYTGHLTPGRIIRSAFKGSGRNNLVSNGGAGVADVKLDLVNGKVLWKSGLGGAGVIDRADLYDCNREPLVTGLNRTEGLALDVVNGKMYFTENMRGFNQIVDFNLDGTGRNVFRILATRSGPFDVKMNPIHRMLHANKYAGANFANRAIRRASGGDDLPEEIILRVFSKWGSIHD